MTTGYESVPTSEPSDNLAPRAELWQRHLLEKKEGDQSISVSAFNISSMHNELSGLSEKSRQRVEAVWAAFSEASCSERKLALQGILNNCSSSLLSFASSTLDSLVRLDFLSLLPVEISFRILSFLDARSLCQAAQVSKHWKELADDDVIWHRMCEQHINRKCEKCGWGLPLLERNTLYAAKASIQKRYERLTKRGVDQAHESSPVKKAKLDDYPTSSNEETISSVKPPSPNSDSKFFLPFKTRPWKEVYAERCRVECNWRHGRCRQVVLSGHSDGVMCLQLVRNILASGSYDATIRLWNLATFQQVALLEGHSSGVTCLQFDQCKLISGSMDKTIRIWNYRTSECISILHGHTDSVLCLTFDSTLLVSGSADCTVKLWHFSGGKRITLRGHTGPVNSVRIIRDRGLVLSGSDDSTIKIWSLETNTCLHTFSAHIGPVQSLALADSRLFSCSLDGTIKQWDIEKKKCVHTLFGHIEGVWEIAADHLRLISGAHDGVVKVWEACECVHTLKNHSEPVTSVALGDCEVVSGSEDGKIYLWLFNNAPNESPVSTQSVPISSLNGQRSNSSVQRALSSVPNYSSSLSNISTRNLNIPPSNANNDDVSIQS
ncbi:F-box/WD repeat-containing protein pof1 [Schizosaccharomyces pombe]|uniref:F-box/WD repeat-containing protein pof1 n=1 Tax=Schizosaccharomyces pombe (strain 972 / ATCC 24843) TaxID=284812 RepID=POF1_SCHPO|nr:F-box/WD repeat-containing protein Pof1 [Schizosaccharomyces pombe]P87053.1 RecName: Full=F-box/WD repeat-containing protein pof1; AltName: Full=Skp1-binding protein 1 [Schizosaccharomyces pombe 972h-]BAA84528.1 Pof1 [Schizosaccharomyces pombe]CAB08168.1 F-box/WD repeat protein protein Pof1 [Schizosaccharomyces pombe]|eukprot:NP_593310.1 F-box/WD repeat-containing protein Pof1 [Schizosaccharomyces pombe]